MPGTWTVVRCRVCGLAFTNPRPRGEGIFAYYPESYGCYLPPTAASARPKGLRGLLKAAKGHVRRQMLRQHFGYFPDEVGRSAVWAALTIPLRNRDRVKLTPRFPRSSPGPKLLEIGCGVGGYLLSMKTIGWNVVGVEPSEAAAEIARQQGLDVRTGTLEQARFAPGEFEAITLNMVLEHVPSPRKALKLLGGWLNPGGELLIAVPDFNGFEARTFGKYHYGPQVPTHLHHFTPATLRKLLVGFRLEVRHQYFHRDLKAELEFYLEDHPESRWRILLKLPRRAFAAAA